MFLLETSNFVKLCYIKVLNFAPKKHCFTYRSQKSQNQKKFRDAVLGDEQAAVKGAVKKRRKKDEGDALPKVSRVEVEEVGCHD